VCQIHFDAAAGAPALHVLARRDIAAGEELTLCRLADACAPREVRAAQLRAALGLLRCECARCAAPADDAEAVRCPSAGCVGALPVLRGSDSSGGAGARSMVEAATLGACAACCVAPDGEAAAAALAARERALAVLASAQAAAAAAGAAGDRCGADAAAATATAALAALHPADAGALRGGLAVLREVTAPARAASAAPGAAAGPPRPSEADAAAALGPALALSEAVAAAARAAPYVDPALLQALLVDHALLCGMAGCGARGVDAWRDVAALARRYNPTGSPMHELYASFAAKPPRNANEAAAARRMRAVAAESLAASAAS
jgi:hypothetical protein